MNSLATLLRPQIMNHVSSSIEDYFDVNRPKQKVHVTKVDILALSCAYHRLTQLNRYSVGSLNDPELHDVLKEEDHILAQKIRSYFSQKIVMWNLKGISLSQFRLDLAKFLQTDGKSYKESITGLIYRLPGMYLHDVELDALIQEHQLVPLTKKNSNPLVGTQGVFRLTTLKKINSLLSHSKKTEYWFKSEDNNLFEISIDMNNPLIHIWNKIFDSSDTLTIESIPAYIESSASIAHWRLTKWQILD